LTSRMRMLRTFIRRAIRDHLGVEVRKVTMIPSIPERELYKSFFMPAAFAPWEGRGEFGELWNLAKAHTLLSPDRLYILYALASHALNLVGEFWECGVYQGGTARVLAELLRRRAKRGTSLHLFDTFAGLPTPSPGMDLLEKGKWANTTLEAVQALTGPREDVHFHQGIIPATFTGRQQSRIAFAHVDVDLYRSVRDCSEFVYPRLVPGGILLFDDYGDPYCPGARRAVDEFFKGRRETPIVLPTCQALVIKLSEID
jgi:O-methyltransferase